MGDELKLDETIARSSPGGVVDYSTFEALEEALDKADAPITEDGRFLTLVERVNALAARAQGPGPGEAVEACVADIKAGLCCPRVHGCEQNDDDQYCLVRQAFIRAGLLPDPDAATPTREA